MAVAPGPVAFVPGRYTTRSGTVVVIEGQIKDLPLLYGPSKATYKLVWDAEGNCTQAISHFTQPGQPSKFAGLDLVKLIRLMNETPF